MVETFGLKDVSHFQPGFSLSMGYLKYKNNLNEF